MGAKGVTGASASLDLIYRHGFDGNDIRCCRDFCEDPNGENGDLMLWSCSEGLYASSNNSQTCTLAWNAGTGGSVWSPASGNTLVTGVSSTSSGNVHSGGGFRSVLSTSLTASPGDTFQLSYKSSSNSRTCSISGVDFVIMAQQPGCNALSSCVLPGHPASAPARADSFCARLAACSGLVCLAHGA